jgi:hypothetical protein
MVTFLGNAEKSSALKDSVIAREADVNYLSRLLDGLPPRSVFTGRRSWHYVMKVPVRKINRHEMQGAEFRGNFVGMNFALTSPVRQNDIEPQNRRLPVPEFDSLTSEVRERKKRELASPGIEEAHGCDMLSIAHQLTWFGAFPCAEPPN